MKIFFAIFAFVSVFHIVCIILKKETLRRISKICIIPPLLAAFVAGAGDLPFFPVPALVFGWFGDILLIKKDKRKYFKLGLLAFLLGHICYLITFMLLLRSAAPDIPALAIFTPQAFVLGIVVFRLIKPFKDLFVPVIFYMAALVTMGLFGFQIFLFNPGLGGLLIVSGCFNFMISDTILAYYAFRKTKVSGVALTMVFYTLAQTEIILGLLSL